MADAQKRLPLCDMQRPEGLQVHLVIISTRPLEVIEAPSRFEDIEQHGP